MEYLSTRRHGLGIYLTHGTCGLLLEFPLRRVSSSKPLASESKGFVFWVELVAPGLPSAGYLFDVVYGKYTGGRLSAAMC
ncbi:hypothetical protein H5410_012730 [Solanum commersonii]|uniref:Uncharacterized protein n=1 Tax=Solanum commersonii TaxID=4109 RepID=A0A9J6ASF5_SOLCO|nr:hypothetical protein H5410_012730 [Solanum commersonii]